MKKFLSSPILPAIVTVAFLFSLFFFQRQGKVQQYKLISEQILQNTYSRDSLSTHFNFSKPAQFGLEIEQVSLPCYDRSEYTSSESEIQQAITALETLSVSGLSKDAKNTCSILLPYLQDKLMGSEYKYFEEPLSATSGIHTSLPILLSEYTMKNEKDVKDYLNLLEVIPDYFKSLSQFEADKAASGKFMSADDTDLVVSQCDFFCTEKGMELYTSNFRNNLSNVFDPESEEYKYYLSDHERILNTMIVPAYQRLGDSLLLLREDGKPRKGLCQYDKGQEYYNYLLSQQIGTTESCDEIEKKLTDRLLVLYEEFAETKKQYYNELKSSGSYLEDTNKEDTKKTDTNTENSNTKKEVESKETESKDPATEESKETLNTAQNQYATTDDETDDEVENATDNTGSDGKDPAESKEQNDTDNQTSAVSTSSSMNLNEYLPTLEQRMSADFPKMNSASPVTIKEIPDALLNYTAPAYYFTPSISLCSPRNVSDIQNVIYINPAARENSEELFTTLAHEGFPGHMYQNVYFIYANGVSRDNVLRYCLDFPGYSEGWAMYVELMSYDYAGEDKTYLHLLRLSREIQLCVLCYLDIQIHENGAQVEEISPYLARIGIKESDDVNNVYSYLINEPGTYLKYYVGYLELLECKELYKETCEKEGEEFTDLKFHTFFLKHGPDSYTRIKNCIAR